MKLIRLKSLALIVIGSVLFQACQDDEGELESDQGVQYDGTAYNLYVGDFEQPNIALDNKLTIQGVRLGRLLFYEKQMSKDGTMSCASCHRQEDAFTDTSRFSEGVRGKFGKRQAMAVFNMAWNENEFFWDGRAHLLRDQSLKPIEDSLEMDETLENVIKKLEAMPLYRDQFIRAFGSAEITEERMSLAMEQFMNSIVSVDSRYDRYLRGEITLDSNEIRGLQLFSAEYNPSFPSLSGADCVHCHSGLNFENDRYLNNGLDTDADMKDDGRMEVTNNASDRAKFKVPSLRNVEVTAPYMHDGRFNTLEAVIDHYNSGLKNSTTIDATLIYPLNNGGLLLSAQDKEDLLAFLKTLTDEVLLSNPEYSDPFE